jgi:hypothetical protein
MMTDILDDFGPLRVGAISGKSLLGIGCGKSLRAEAPDRNEADWHGSVHTEAAILPSAGNPGELRAERTL